MCAAKDSASLTSDYFNDESYENLSTEELAAKIDIFHTLWLENKINKNNAFDIDMIGYFSTWLEKNKLTKTDDNDSVDSFQKIADYLEASEKVYGLRVDNFNENTSRLVDQFKIINHKKDAAQSSDGNNLPKTTKPKRQRLMLTTADKLRRKPTEKKNFIDPSIKQNVCSIDFKELFQTTTPAEYLMSLYSDALKIFETKPDDTKPDDTKPDDTKPDDTKPNDTKPDDTKPDDTKPDDTKPDDTKPDDTKPDDTKPDDTKPDDTKPNDTKPDDTKSDDTKPDDTKPDDTKPDDKKPNDTKVEDDKDSFITIKDISKQLAKGTICSAFEGYVAEKDKSEDIEAAMLDGIEHHFDPENYSFQNRFANSNNENDCDIENGIAVNIATATCSGNDGLLGNDGLASGSIKNLEDCIDGVHREYSFFNPRLLARWKGPKAWKAQAMLKALKSCKKTDPKIPLDSDVEDEILDHILKKTYKKRIDKIKKIKINWLELKELEEFLNTSVTGKEQISANTLNKWNPFNNIVDNKTITIDMIYKYTCLKYIESQRALPLDKEKVEIDNSDGTSEVINDDILEAEDNNSSKSYINSEVSEYIKNVTSYLAAENIHSDDDDDDKDDDAFAIQTRVKLDIGSLKKEISQIIDEECIKIDSDDVWTSRLPFEDLLVKLKISEREELSVPNIYVAVLHLANERGLKLFQEPNDDGIKPLFIAKSLDKM